MPNKNLKNSGIDKTKIDKTPTKVPITGLMFPLTFVKNPSKNNPSIPPLKIEANFHHASRALLIFIIARATEIPKSAIKIVEP